MEEKLELTVNIIDDLLRSDHLSDQAKIRAAQVITENILGEIAAKPKVTYPDQRGLS